MILLFLKFEIGEKSCYKVAVRPSEIILAGG